VLLVDDVLERAGDDRSQADEHLNGKCLRTAVVVVRVTGQRDGVVGTVEDDRSVVHLSRGKRVDERRLEHLGRARHRAGEATDFVYGGGASRVG
jgi:hypothetical protein